MSLNYEKTLFSQSLRCRHLTMEGHFVHFDCLLIAVCDAEASVEACLLCKPVVAVFAVALNRIIFQVLVLFE